MASIAARKLKSNRYVFSIKTISVHGKEVPKMKTRVQESIPCPPSKTVRDERDKVLGTTLGPRVVPIPSTRDRHDVAHAGIELPKMKRGIYESPLYSESKSIKDTSPKDISVSDIPIVNTIVTTIVRYHHRIMSTNPLSFRIWETTHPPYHPLYHPPRPH